MHSKSVAAIFGEIVWLMSQSARHRDLVLGSLEASVMPAILLRQFRIFYQEQQPIAAVLYARLSNDLHQCILTGKHEKSLTFEDWQSGQIVHIKEVVSPFSESDPFVTDTLEKLRQLGSVVS